MMSFPLKKPIKSYVLYRDCPLCNSQSKLCDGHQRKGSFSRVKCNSGELVFGKPHADQKQSFDITKLLWKISMRLINYRNRLNCSSISNSQGI